MSAQVLAVDLGAESGRVMAATLAGGRVEVREAHRFPNRTEEINGTLRWRIDELFGNIVEGLAAGVKGGVSPVSVSTDTWGVDFGLFGTEDQLLEAPYCYRDARTQGMPEAVFARVSRARVFEATGLQFMDFNTVYQFAAAAREPKGALARAARFLMMADLLNHWMGGEGVAEESLASTTQIFDPRAMDWSWSLVEVLGLPKRVFPKVVKSGTVIGTVKEQVRTKTGLAGSVKVVASCSHDTGAAVAAVPAEDGDDWAYLSSGTWSLMGVELPKPLINADVLAANFTNEVGFGSSIRFLKNISGLWLVQESRREWERQGKAFTYPDLTARAAAAEPFRCLIEPDDARFLRPGDMPGKIRGFLKETGQPEAADEGAVVRCALESLALKYAAVLDGLERLTKRKVRVLHVVGGGSQNGLLCQMTANAIGRPVLAGPVEATGLGNAMVQMVAAGVVGSLAEMRRVIRDSFPLQRFEPADGEAWCKARERFAALPKK